MKKKEISKPVTVSLCLIIFFSFSFSIREYLHLRKLDVITAYKESITEKIKKNHNTLTNANVNLIESWMTFDYVNLIFNLPENYLKNSLDITSAHYPNISISKYAKYHKLLLSQYLSQVQSTVADYFSPHA